jgi:competence protein ComEC
MLIHPPVTAADLAYYNGERDSPRMAIVGQVVAEPAYSDRSQRLRVAAQLVRLPGEIAPHTVSGDMYAILPRYPAYSVGERLVLSGTLTAPPQLSDFDYRAYLAREGVYSYMLFPRATSLGPGQDVGLAGLVAWSRAGVRAALRRSIPEPQASLAVGVVTGDRSSIPEDVEEAFRRSGTTHILAISGQNITLIVGIIWLAYSKLGGRRRMSPWLFLVVLALLAAYTLFTGSTPSVVRASFMGGVLLLAPLVGRRYDPMAALAVSAALMCVADPDVLADAGFQLSFAGMLGITLVAPRLYDWSRRYRIPKLLAIPLSASLGAQAMTLPLVALIAGSISIVSPLATLTADVVLFPLMLAGIATGIIGIWVEMLGALFGILTWLSAAWLIWWVELWAAFPWASIAVGEVEVIWVVVYYAILGLTLWYRSDDKPRQAARHAT